MSDKAQALGIPEGDLKRAMILVRDLRIQVINEALDPRATRIALIFANLVDYHFARQRLGLEELVKLEEIAGDFYKKQGGTDMNYWTAEGKILGLSKVQPNADIYLPVKMRNMLKVEPGDYVAWVQEAGNIVVRKGRYQPPKMSGIKS